MSATVKKFRHIAETPFGTFRADFNGQRYPFAVIYCGWHALPEATKRRVEAKEGICYAWALSEDAAQDLADKAVQDGLTNVIIADVRVRELP